MMNTKDINQEIELNAKPSEVYELLMNAEKHSNLTGAPALIEDKEGSSFNVYEGYITGTNTKLIKDKLIVQKWRAEEEGWPEDYFSDILFDLNEIPTGTRILFQHNGVPEHVADSISKGWETYYWSPMREYFEEKRK